MIEGLDIIPGDAVKWNDRWFTVTSVEKTAWEIDGHILVSLKDVINDQIHIGVCLPALDYYTSNRI